MPPTTFDQQTAPMRGRYTQYYDRNGVLQQGDPYEALSRDHAQWQADVRRRQSAAWRNKAFRTAAGGAALFGGGALLGGLAGGAGAGAAAGAAPSSAGYSSPGIFSGLFGGGAPSAAAGGGAAAGTGAATGAGLFSPNNLLRLGELGVGTVTSLLGQRSQNRALDRETASRERELAQQMAYAREQDQIRREEFLRQQAELERAQQAEERFREQQWNAQEEERLYDRRLRDEREGRRTRYRSTIGDPALFRMAEILRLGGR